MLLAKKLTRRQRLYLTLTLSVAFFVVELTLAFYTRSLALVSDAFHYLADILSFGVTFFALIISERGCDAGISRPGPLGAGSSATESASSPASSSSSSSTASNLSTAWSSSTAFLPPQELSFGWARAPLLGAFFNGAFLFAMGVGIFLQALQRCMDVHPVEKPQIVLVVGCVGLVLNIISAAFLHEHQHEHRHEGGDDTGLERCEAAVVVRTQVMRFSFENTMLREEGEERRAREDAVHEPHASHRHRFVKLASPGHDLNVFGAFLHVLGDAANNVGVIVSALVIWLTRYKGRYYADPGVGLGIAILIMVSAVPLVKRSGSILLQSAPPGINLDDVKHDIESMPGILSVHELHIWRLDQSVAVASAHIVMDETRTPTSRAFMEKARLVGECLHAYGIHSATLQPEVLTGGYEGERGDDGGGNASGRLGEDGKCQIGCGRVCGGLMCCK